MSVVWSLPKRVLFRFGFLAGLVYVYPAPFGYIRLRLENYADDDLKRWAERLAATGWRAIYTYFMHEPTAPPYAQTLLRFGNP